MTISTKVSLDKRVVSAKESTRKFSGIARFRYESALDLIKNKNVLDIGCGFTSGSYYLATHGAKTVLGIDYSKEVIDKVSQSYKAKNLKYLWLNIFEVESLKNKFDVVIAFELLEHLPIPLQSEFFDAVKKIIKPNGKLIITTPNRLIASKGRSKPRTPFHTREFSPLELRRLIGQKVSDVDLYGLEYKDKDYLKTRDAIVNSPKYYLVSFFEQFNWVHQLIFYLPSPLKKILSAYAPIPDIDINNLRWTKTNLNQAESLMAVCHF